MMAENLTEDRFFDGALRLRQPAKGHRIGSDAVLLAAAAPEGARILCDLGAGVGAVGLRAAQQEPEALAHLCEIDAATGRLAEENAALNGLSGRVSVHGVDVLSKAFARGEIGPAPRSCDVVVTNPPFFEEGRSRPSPDADRRRAHAMAAPLEAWLKAGLSRLQPKGRLIVIHRADALARLLAALEGKAGDIRLRFIHPGAEKPAHRVLLSARAGSRAPLVVLPPLALHDASGAFTPEAEAIHRGQARIGWS